MAQIDLTPEEVEALAGYINEEFDGIDLYPGDLGDGLGLAAEEVARLHDTGGQGDISPASARLAADVLSYFVDTYREMMVQPGEVETVESTVAKLRAVASGS
jgi:hypothetical protein